MENQVKILREKKNMTQNELAEKSKLSLRTVQRIETGSTLKGFTLNALAQALDSLPEDLLRTTENIADAGRAKIINLSALFGLIFPFGGVIAPAFFTYRTKDPRNKELGKGILCVQIILAVIFSCIMIASPFIQKMFLLKFPLFIIPLLLFLALKLYIVIKNGISLNQKQELSIKLKNNFL
ncbi:helix-turn-helix domain-containing protein (plasmid) [Chryseobacterium arthrosphaerae]|uniref:Helix-turn-helix domain-containing protein n=1 Tax=Chryseobacterium arthrosphaerae TaxID=651561 RepID=A0A432DYB8_9FLAO|nr:helix-turn-helix domain-containing protein [Chryseobacterium arthrosphaerae]